MNKLWTERIPWWWQRLYWNADSEDILSDRVNLHRTYLKYALFAYFLLVIKIHEVVETVFEGYEVDDNLFDPVHERLEDLYSKMYRAMVTISNRRDFKMCEVALLRSFSTLNGDFKQSIRDWVSYKTQIAKDISQLSSEYPKPYPIPHDLQVCFGEIDYLLTDHRQKKQTLLDKDKHHLLEFGELSLNLSTAQLTYKTTTIDIQLDRKEVRLLVELLKEGGKVVSYQELAKAIDIGSFNEDSDVKDLATKLQAVKRDLGKYLKVCGIHPRSINHIIDHIVAVKNQGYKLIL